MRVKKQKAATRRLRLFRLGMAGVTGLEPAASGVTGRRSNQLSYTPMPFRGFEVWTMSAVRSGVYVKQPRLGVKR